MRRLPGVSVIDLPAAAGDDLPPMDVPVFVGFAERGPLHRPVMLEDAAQFAGVFGQPFELVGAADGRSVQAHLPAAVLAFFAGGGRRCHVVRVAGRGVATTRFVVPGVRLARRAVGATAWTLDAPDTPVWLQAGSPGSWADRLMLSTRLQASSLGAADAVLPGDLLRVQSADATAVGYLSVTKPGTLAAALSRDAVLWHPLTQPAGAAPALAASADRLRLDLRVRQSAQAELGIAARQWQRDGCGLGARGTGLPWTDADVLQRLDDGPRAAAPGDWPLAGDPALRDVTGTEWIVVPCDMDAGLVVSGDADPGFGAGSPAVTGAGDGLERNGLAVFEHSLFTDPAWTPEARLQGAALRRWADDRRYFGSAVRRLHGLHAALGFQADPVREATWIAVPDAVHVGWAREPAPSGIEGRLVLGDEPPCAGVADAFVPCTAPPRAPATPALSIAPHVPGAVDAALVEVPAGQPWWLLLQAYPNDSGAPGVASATRVELQVAQEADFSDARPLPQAAVAGAALRTLQGDPTPGTAQAVPGAIELTLVGGLHFLRARSWRNGLHSDWCAPRAVHARAPARRLHDTPAVAADSVVAVVHQALIDLADATREHFVLLSVPAAWREADVAAHVTLLREHAGIARVDVGDPPRRDERTQAASFAALHHPWPLQVVPAGVSGEDAGALQARTAAARIAAGWPQRIAQAHPPEGALLGQYAQRTRSRGGWAAAGLEALVWTSGVDQALDPAALEAAGANAIELRPRGICATRAATLDTDADWSAIGVRRLFILLRALARREGERFAFEPNDAALRRSLERSFERLLQGLMQRGAFRGERASQAYALRTASGSQLGLEVERGQCSLEIRVAPSRPLRFLTLYLRRSGEQWQIEEGA